MLRGIYFYFQKVLTTYIENVSETVIYVQEICSDEDDFLKDWNENECVR